MQSVTKDQLFDFDHTGEAKLARTVNYDVFVDGQQVIVAEFH